LTPIRDMFLSHYMFVLPATHTTSDGESIEGSVYNGNAIENDWNQYQLEVPPRSRFDKAREHSSQGPSSLQLQPGLTDLVDGVLDLDRAHEWKSVAFLPQHAHLDDPLQEITSIIDAEKSRDVLVDTSAVGLILFDFSRKGDLFSTIEEDVYNSKKKKGFIDAIDVQSTTSGTTFFSTATFLSHGSDGLLHRSERQTHSVDNLHTSRARKAGLLDDGNSELDWSGFGMHVHFPNEAELPFTIERGISQTSRAIVDAVRCRRILLARKTMLCHRRFTPEEAIEEVKHLQKLRHSHVTRLVGSYFQRRSLSILTYPVADCDLDSYLRGEEFTWDKKSGLWDFCGCLSAALDHLHKRGIKHMDIKPKNILVKRLCGDQRHVYLTDFGISRQIEDWSCEETNSPIGRTEKYCSPEVAAGEPRGLSSDIFSLGCVFAEMLTVVVGSSIQAFDDARTDDGISFHRNLPLVHKWLQNLVERYCAMHNWSLLSPSPTKGKVWITHMLNEEKEKRPSASMLIAVFPKSACCTEESPQFAIDK
jgi:hypothetical protein